MKNLFIIIQREYFERVRKKSFLITTILMPVLMIALMVAPALIMAFSTPDHNRIAVIDPSGLIADNLKNNEYFDIVKINGEPDSAIDKKTIDGYLVVPGDLLENPEPVIALNMNGAIPLDMESSLKSQINDIVENHKLLSYNIENLPTILEKVRTNVSVNEKRLDQEDNENLSSSLSFFIGIAMSFLLYMFILMYGQMVMTSIIEEKNNRVLELIVSSVKPTQLMMGKIAGIGLVAVTQILIWGAVLAFVAAIALPAIIAPEAMAQVTAMRAGTLDLNTVSDLGMVNTLSVLTNAGYIIQLFCWLILFLIGGFLLYAAMFATVGSAVDNIQDASQLQSFIIIPILIALVVSTSVGNAPNSALAFWLSIIPFTSPMVMMSRIPAGIEAWQPWVSLAVLYLSFLAMVWFAGKVYRVGIFMYGKKPKVKDLIRWAKYK